MAEGEVSLLRVCDLLFQILVALAHAQLVGVSHCVRREVVILVIAKVEVILPRVFDSLLSTLDLAGLLRRIERAVTGSSHDKLLTVRYGRHF